MAMTPEQRKDSARESQLKYRAANRGKTQARLAVRYALKTGKLTKTPCEGCQNAKSEAHHDDYSKQLEVRWLCKACHGQWHYLMRMDGRYTILADGTPSKIELPGFAVAPPGYVIEGYIPSAEGWTTRVKRVETPVPVKWKKTLVKRNKSATKA